MYLKALETFTHNDFIKKYLNKAATTQVQIFNIEVYK